MLDDKKQINWDDYDRSRNKRYSHHEAGHAFADFLFGEARGIDHICMRGNDKFAARVRSQGGKRIMVLGMANDGAAVFRDLARRASYAEILKALAGPSAENKVDDESTDYWFDDLTDEFGMEGTDLDHAYEMAFAFGRTEARAWAILKMVAGWTDELIAIPRVWGTITALAANLPHDSMMSGADAFRIMESAWGGDGRLPFFELGRKWGRRFATPKSLIKAQMETDAQRSNHAA